MRTLEVRELTDVPGQALGMLDRNPSLRALGCDPYMVVPTSWLTSLSPMLSSGFHCSGLAAPSLALHQPRGVPCRAPSSAPG